MKQATKDRHEVLESLERLNGDDGIDDDGPENENPETGEAEQTGGTVSRGKAFRPLTANQQRFVEGVISGMSQRAAYAQAYPNDKSSPVVMRNSASRLSKHPLVRQMIQDGWGDTIELLADDVAATKRYVLSQLLTLSKSAKQEGSRLKALELMARSVGMFRDVAPVEEPTLSAEQLKRQLSTHLKLLGSK